MTDVMKAEYVDAKIEDLIAEMKQEGDVIAVVLMIGKDNQIKSVSHLKPEVLGMLLKEAADEILECYPISKEDALKLTIKPVVC